MNYAFSGEASGSAASTSGISTKGPLTYLWPSVGIRRALAGILGCAAACAFAPGSAVAQTGAPADAWPHYGGDLGSTKYSPLGMIDSANVSRIGPAWVWESPDNALVAADETLSTGTFKATPILVDGVLYVRTTLSVVAAVDARTGEQLWTFDPEAYRIGRPANLGFNTRGVAYWSAGGTGGPPAAGAAVPSDSGARIFVATADARLWALDAATGRPVPDFGNRGEIDLIEGLGRAVERGSDYQVMSPPLVVGDVVVVGSSISDGDRSDHAPPGDVRAFDVRTGKLVWTFHTIPRPGEVGNETWENGSWATSGNTNVWTMMSADPELGLVYLPVSTPTYNFYGGHRPGDNLFGESLVALEATTGRRVWHFQLVHHGVWDYDPPAAPTLLDVTVDGEPVRAVAQVTKQGFVYAFDRATGEPIWPIVERPVPASPVPGEHLSATQPFPTRPAPFERQGMSYEDLIDFSPELRAEAFRVLERSDYGGLFYPPTERGTMMLPGWGGGANWYGAGVDPETGVLYVPSRTSPTRVQLVRDPDENAHVGYRRGGDQSTAGPDDLPLVKPPYARLTAIDMNTGDHVWQVPLGDGIRQRLIDMGIPDPGPVGGGGYTGPLVTSTLLFIGHTGARSGEEGGPALLAMDKASGELIHAIELPFRPAGAPMTYAVDGRQHLVVAGGSGGETGMVALTLE